MGFTCALSFPHPFPCIQVQRIFFCVEMPRTVGDAIRNSHPSRNSRYGPVFIVNVQQEITIDMCNVCRHFDEPVPGKVEPRSNYVRRASYNVEHDAVRQPQFTVHMHDRAQILSQFKISFRGAGLAPQRSDRQPGLLLSQRGSRAFPGDYVHTRRHNR